MQYGLTRSEVILDVREDKGQIVHRLSTLPGQSGTPLICIDRNSKLSIVGIHWSIED